MTDNKNDPIPAQIVVRLSDSERAALANIRDAIKAPYRRSPTVSEAVRAALLTAAGTLATAAGQAGLA